jgi:iron complex outermembrane receptor protein
MGSKSAAALRGTRGRVGLGVVGVMLIGGTLQAQEETGSGLEEVVVTAQKRESTEQKTAIALTVLGNEVLERNGVGDLKDMAVLAPGVNFSNASANVIVAVRGVSSRDTTEIGDPAVSVSTDGFYIQRPIGLADALYDLERVEVLRGPQGTLYGRNATGGAINFITAKPENEFKAKAALTYGNYDLLVAEGMVNMPISDTFQARVAVYSRDRDGFRENEGPRPGDDAKTRSGRVHLRWTPSDNFLALLSAQYTDVGGVGPTMFGYRPPGALDVNYRPPLDPDGTPHGAPYQFIDAKTTTVQLNLEYSLAFADIVYMGGYRKLDYQQRRDLDGLPDSSTYFTPSEKPVDWSHELRLVSNGDGPWQWQMGGYYFDEQNDLLSYFQSYAPSVTNPPLNMFTFFYDVVARSKAVFGQAYYDLTDTLELSAGVRYSKDFKSRKGYANTGAGDVPTDVKGEGSKTTYHVGLDWQVRPSNLLYIKYDTGYKAGGFGEIFQTDGTTVPYTYDPEEIAAIEIGSKNRFFDNNLQLNVAAFYYDYKDQQVTVIVNGLAQVLNAGKSETFGLEVEGSLKLGGGRLDAAIALLDSEFKDFCTLVTATGTCDSDFDYSGNVPPQAPKTQVTLGYEHAFPAFGGVLVPRIQGRYESAVYHGIENLRYQRQDSYTKGDAMLTYTPESGSWSVQAFVRNFTDETTFTSGSYSGLWNSQTYALADPRTYGMRVSFNFQ